MQEGLAESSRRALIGYGVRLLACQLGQPLPTGGPLAGLLNADDLSDPALAWAREQIGDDARLDRPATVTPLRSIFSLIALDDERRQRPERSFVPQRPLDLDLRAGADIPADLLWKSFAADVARLPAGWGMFDTFLALVARYGWAVSGNLIIEGISLYEQFRLVAALVATYTPGQHNVLLVEGDLSGIQEMLYTITSKGAAKNLRGRSFYLQLLSDALGRAVLYALDLPACCLILSAGGNMRLLARAGDAAQLEATRRELNRRLLRLHGGDLAFALDWLAVDAGDLADDAFHIAARDLARRLDVQKARAFAELVADEPAPVVGVVGSGSDYFCAICHAELRDPPASGDPADLRCEQCASFGERDGRNRPGLARLIANCTEAPYMAVQVGPLPELPDLAGWRSRPAWDVALAALGVRYSFGSDARPAADTTLYRLNDTDCLPDVPLADCAYSFRFLALATPRIDERGPQLERLQLFVDQQRQAADQQGAVDDEGDLETRAIRPFALIADWDSTGVDRYGVLRMDVDNLGRLFHQRLEYRSLLHTAALSGAFTRFFEGWLNTVCHEVAASWQADTATVTNDAAWRERINGLLRRAIDQTRRDADQQTRDALYQRVKVGPEELHLRSKQPYVIYAGGDDLFVIGPWDVLPPLAARLRRDMTTYTLRGYVSDAPADAPTPVTLSAGIAAESQLYPLYQAADGAGDALKRAKNRRRRSRRGGTSEWETVKDAITMLGVTVSWEELNQAEQLAYRLARMIDVGVPADAAQERPDHAPHALLQLLASVARSYAEAGGATSEERLAYGRWMPLLAYGLRRMADRAPRHNEALRAQILGLAGETLDLTRVAGAAQWHTLRFLALPVRWAELLIRTGG